MAIKKVEGVRCDLRQSNVDFESRKTMNAYIKAQKSLRHSPKVMHIATILGISTKHAMGIILNCWMFADDYADAENRVYGVTKSVLDKDAEIEGFCDALEAVGWLESGEGFLEFPFYLEKNDTTEKIRKTRKEKKRDQAKERMRRMRERRKSEQENSHNNGVDKSQECYAQECVTSASQERNESVTSASHPNGHYNTKNTKTETQTEKSVTPKFIDELSDENIAQEWCYYCKAKKNRRCRDDVVDITSEISALTEDLKIDKRFLLNEIRSKNRDRSEYFWQFKKRILALWKSQQPTAETNGKRKITNLWELRKAINAGEFGNG